MRICTNCGRTIPDGDLICLFCGQEVQLVPDYETMQSQMHEQVRMQEEEDRRRLEEQKLEQEYADARRARRIRILVAVLGVAAGVLIALIVLMTLQNKREQSSFGYQIGEAHTAYDSGNYAEALRYVQLALAQEPKSEEANMLLARIYLQTGKKDQALGVLQELIGRKQGGTEAKEYLLEIYRERNDGATIQKLLKEWNNADWNKAYAEFLPEAPRFSLPEGTYNDLTQVEILTDAANATIYYTLDGSPPTSGSSVYHYALDLKEGETRIRAFVLLDNGAFSEEAQASYEVSLRVPDAPTISPASGSYTRDIRQGFPGEVEDTAGMLIRVNVPDGFTCRYSFDSRPTESSPLYKEPVEMQEGEHIFYAVLISPEGKMGAVGSATYIYIENTITPTPAPTPRPTQIPVQQPTETETETGTSTEQQTEEPETTEPGNEQPAAEPGSETPPEGGGETPAEQPAEQTENSESATTGTEESGAEAPAA